MAGGGHPDGGRPGGGLGADLSGLMPFMAQFGVLSRMSSGSSTLDLFIALALPMLLSQLGVWLQTLFVLAQRHLSLSSGMHERRIRHQLTTSYWMCFNGQDDEDDAERAPNSVLHRALLVYINHAFADKALTWLTAEVSTRKVIKAGDASGHNSSNNNNNGRGRGGRGGRHRSRDDDSDQDEDSEVPQYSYLVQPPDNQFVRLTPHIELKREVEIREGDNQGNNRNGQREHTVTFVLRARTAQRIDAFLADAVRFYNERLRSNVDKARYMYVPVVGRAAAAGVDGGGSDTARAITYRRYKLGEQRTFASFFHPDKDAILDLVRSFMDKTGRYSIPGFPHKLGFLLHGPPGTGKTSFIKALAHLTGRHVVSIPLSRIRTNQELMNVMHEQRCQLVGEEDTSPLLTSRVIYVLEDVDAASAVVRRRAPPSPGPDTNNANAGRPEQAGTLQPATPSPGSPEAEGVVVAASGPDHADKPASRQLSTEPSPLEVQLLMTQLQLKQVCEAVSSGAAAAAAGAASAGGAGGIEVLGAGCGASGAVVGPAVPWAPKGAGGAGKSSWYKGLLGMGSSADNDDELNLAGLLNVLDGVVDTPERIIIMTTNHPELLDPALVRPGRINKRVYMGNLRLREAARMVAHYYAVEPASMALDEVEARVVAATGGGGWVDGVMSPAELECLCAEHEELEALLAALGSWFAQHGEAKAVVVA